MSSTQESGHCFGADCPGWNITYANGNHTAAELLAYFPNSIRSIDVIDRFISNGGKAGTIAAVINEFRDLPGGDASYKPNSVLITMKNNMRRAGFQDWTPRTHDQFPRPQQGVSKINLNVGTFRPPRLTHPKTGMSAGKYNQACGPVQFKDLARLVKMHPSGNDALDLTRCVEHAVAHPEQSWHYPADFQSFVAFLGGPAQVTRFHLDAEVFARRANGTVSLTSNNTAPTACHRKRKNNVDGNDEDEGEKDYSSSKRVKMTNSSMARKTNVSEATRSAQAGGYRKSGRLAGKATITYNTDTTDNIDSPQYGLNTPTKKRRPDRIPVTPGSAADDGDFFQGEPEADDDIAEPEQASGDDDVLYPGGRPRGRAAARKALKSIRQITTETQRNIDALTAQPQNFMNTSAHISDTWELPEYILPPEPIHPMLTQEEIDRIPEAPGHAIYPRYIPEPWVPPGRIRVDEYSIYLYAAEGCKTGEELWESALSSTRFNGPRSSAPFRELYRLTDPDPTDMSDWAENIRWAKLQHSLYGSDTWSEYDHHLERITQERQQEFWFSSEFLEHLDILWAGLE